LFEYFNEESRQVIVGAQNQAKKLNQNFISEEHIFLSMIDIGVENIVNSLLKYDVNIDSFTEHLTTRLKKWDATQSEVPANAALPFTPVGKQILELSAREAIQTGQHYIYAEHIFLAMLRLSDTAILEYLTKNDVDIISLRKTVTESIVKTESGDEAVNNDDVDSNEPEVFKAFCVNMTQLARDGKFDPVIGREVEVNRVSRILARRMKNNPVLTGEPGIGKTAIVEALAQKIVKGDVPAQLLNKTIYSLNMGALISGTRFRGELEERINNILNELKANSNIILFIDEIHTIASSGDGQESPVNIANQLKPALSRGEVRIIGATTAKEFRKYIEKDAALERRFQMIAVEPPTMDETLLILKGLRDRYEAFHKVTILDEALEASVKYAERYISDRFFPDKAIDLIDEAAAKVKLAQIFGDIDNNEQMNLEMVEAIRKGDFVEAAQLKKRISGSDETVVETGFEEDSEDSSDMTNVEVIPEITEDDIASVVSEITGIPVYKISDHETVRLKFMEEELTKKVIGQPEAVKAVSQAIKRMKTGVRDSSKPISFIFAGSTGVGKTELSKALAGFLFDDTKSLITLDMSEYSEQYSVSRLMGAPPGYVGYDSGGQLTEHVNRRPYSVILFDEIEKAHPTIFNTLLQILDEGRMTDGQGRVINFKNTIIILTTNLGGNELTKNSLGFTTIKDEAFSYEDGKKIVNNVLKQNFRPEFLNRIDEVVMFHKLTVADAVKIVNKFVGNLNERIIDLGYRVNVSEAAKTKLAENGYSAEHGARPMARVIQSQIEDKLSNMIINGEIHPGETLHVDVNDGDLIFTTNGQKNVEMVELTEA
jgi:ATP-dependent Clp protease ATP-binding subunit ClpC